MISVKKQMFAREYLLDYNATRAARACGAPRDSAYQRGYDWLHDPAVAAYIGDLVTERVKKIELTGEELLRRYANIITADRRELVDDDGRYKSLNELPECMVDAIDGYKIGKDGVEIKLVSKRSAMRDYGEALAIFKQVTEVNDTRRAAVTDEERAQINKGLDSAF